MRAASAGQSRVTIRRTPHGADDREATPSGPPSPRTDPDVRRQAYRPRLFTHACDAASASPAAIAFREVGAARSVRPTLSGQSLRSGHGFLCRLRMPVSPLSRSGARRTVSMTERPREAARPLPAPGTSGRAASDCRPDHDLGGHSLSIQTATGMSSKNLLLNLKRGQSLLSRIRLDIHFILASCV